MKFDPSQRRAIDEIHEVLASPRSRLGRQFTLGGYAGTGKTTIVRKVLENAEKADINIAVGSFTGKAVDVLRRKGIQQAQTLHSLMYEFDPHTRTFHKLDKLFFDGILVDEASMVSRILYDDLQSFNIPIIWIGDHGQLEPIGENPNVMAKPDLVLERIYRQAEGSAILDVAHAFREGKMPDWKVGPEVDRITMKEAEERILDYDVVLCGLNGTRRNLNQFIRRKKGYVLNIEQGETMVCLKNNREHGVFNGMLLKVTKIHRRDGETFFVDFEEVGTGRHIPRVRCVMPNDETEVWKLPRDVIAVDYGYVLSVHKSQGSEFNRVLVIEERGGWDMRRWRYTAASRAADHLSWTR